MPGLHTIMGNVTSTPLKKSDFSFTLHKKNFEITILSQNSDYCTAISFHDEFPFQKWEDSEIHIVLQGLIYNRTDDDIQTNLWKIAEHFVHKNDYKKLVKNFVESSDGDYTVQILHKTSNRILFFNDYLGRFSLYYYCKDNIFVCSTEIKTILNFIPKIRINKSSLVEFLMFQFPLGNKTLFSDIFITLPSQMIVIQKNGDTLSIDVSSSADLNFVLKNPFNNEKESIEYIKDLFLKAVQNRVDTLEKQGYGIIADLSGRYDSRAVLAGLSKFTKNVEYFTFEYTQDESPWAKGIFQQLGSPGMYYKCSFNNVIDETEIGHLIYMTDGMINYKTTSGSYKDLEYIKKNWPRKAGQFHGYGGEFIRHPFQYFSNSLTEVCDSRLYSALSIDLACKIIRINCHDYKNELTVYFNTYPEKSPEDQLRRFYYEYFFRLGAGIDNRERILSWAVNPFLSPSFLRTVFSRIPLQWAGYNYFIKFMCALDPRLTKYPIYDSDINLQSRFGIFRYEIRERLNNFIIRTPSLFSLYKHPLRQKRTEKDTRLLEKFRFCYDSVSFSSTIFNREIIESNLFINEGDTKRLITLLIYFKELEDRFKEKIVV
jgi:hypothetical protein